MKRIFTVLSLAAVMLGCEKPENENQIRQPDVPSGGLNPYLPSELALPAIMSDNMVLQQNSRANIWGKAIPGSQITIQTTWTEETFTGITDNDGIWVVPVATPAATTEPQSITITDSQRAEEKIENILIGEVWLCSGQSNMEMPMRGFGVGRTTTNPC